MIRFVDLFAGTGGLRLGFEQALNHFGIENECQFSSDIDVEAQETYELNFGERPAGDINDNMDEIPPFDFLLAGFPCQPFSYAGKRVGFGDTRGTLFFTVEELLKKYRPSGFLLENVRGLTTHDEGRTFETIINALRELGYTVDYKFCNSSNFGVPQNRVRVFIYGSLEGSVDTKLASDLGAADSHSFKAAQSQRNLFNQPSGIRTVSDILEDDVDKKYLCSEKFVKMLATAVGGEFDKLHGVRLIDYRGGNSLHSWDLGVKGACSSEERAFMSALIANRRKKKFGTHQDGKKLTLTQIKTFHDNPKLEATIGSLVSKGYLSCDNGRYNPVCGNMSFEVFKFLDPNSISITLTSSDAHKLGVVSNNKPRRLTPREAARLQGFPDSYKLHQNDKATYKQMGNAVSVPVVKSLMIDLISCNQSLLASSKIPVSNSSLMTSRNCAKSGSADGEKTPALC